MKAPFVLERLFLKRQERRKKAYGALSNDVHYWSLIVLVIAFFVYMIFRVVEVRICNVDSPATREQVAQVYKDVLKREPSASELNKAFSTCAEKGSLTETLKKSDESKKLQAEKVQ